MIFPRVLMSVFSRLAKSIYLTVAATVFLLFLFSTLKAQDISIQPEPTWLYKTSERAVLPRTADSVNDGYYLEYINTQNNLQLQTAYRKYIRHIVNESGVQNASEISVSFDPAYQKLVFHQIALVRNGQRINQLSLDQIKVVQEETDAERYQYNGMKRAFVILQGTRKDDRIEYAYSLIGYNPVLKDHYTGRVYFSTTDWIGNYFQTFIVPADRKLLFKTYNGAVEPNKIVKDNFVIYHWSNPPLKTYESQNQVPVWFDNYPYVEISEFRDWKEVATWGYNLFNQYRYELPAELRSKISVWRSMAKGDNDMFATLATRFVQDEVRYLGMEDGMYSHKPHLPADVFRQRYGDCKDKALLLTTILRQEGIPAFVALVSTERRSQLQFAPPSIEDFDHALVAVERSSGFVFVDATVNYQRGEFSTTYIPNYGFALLLREGENTLQPIEPGYPYSVEIVERYSLPMKDSIRLAVETIYKGGEADGFRANIAEMSIKELSQSCLQYYEKFLDGIKTIRTVETTDDSIQNELTLRENYVIPSFWKALDNGKMSIDLYVKSVHERIPDPTGVYTDGPMALEFPLTLRYSMILEMDEKYEFPVEDIHLKTSSYQFDFTSTVNGNVIELKYFYKTFKDHIPKSEVADYKAAYSKIEEYLSFNFSSGGSVGNVDDKQYNNSPSVNWLMVLISCFVLGGMILLFRKLDNRVASVVGSTFASERIGGWVAFLGFSMFTSVIFQLYNFFSAGYFSEASWRVVESSGGRFLQFVFVAEMVFDLLVVTFLCFLIFWYVKRRDIFPTMFISYIIVYLGLQFVLIGLYIITRQVYPGFEVPVEHTLQLVRLLVYGAIWTTYLRRSERVKNTFVVSKKKDGPMA